MSCDVSTCLTASVAAPILDRLRREHQKIAALLDDLQEVISTDGADPLLVLPEVERLTDELESHLTYEEEQLIPILDASTPGAGATATTAERGNS